VKARVARTDGGRAVKGRVTSYRVMQAVMILSGIAITVYNIFAEPERVRILLGPVNLLFLLIPPVVERLFRLKLGDRLKSVLLAFILVSFSFGTAVRGYDLFPPLDAIAHLISGVLFTLIGMCFYVRLRKEPGDLREEWFLLVTYAFFFSMFIAVLWELYEYAAFLLTGHDAQHHLDTGVIDTMEDILACFVGSLLMALSFIFYCKRGIRLFMVRTLEQFIALNPKK
jgi:hypothetical protein